MAAWEIVAYALTAILSALSIIGGVSTDFFGLVEPGADAAVVSTGVAIVILLIGDRTAGWIRDKHFRDEVTAAVSNLARSLPSYYVIHEFASSDNAVQYICQRLPLARAAFNTKICRDAIPLSRDAGDKYMIAVRSALDVGVFYKDIVSPGYIDYAEELRHYQGKGQYHFRVLDTNVPSFLNFIALEYDQEDEEVIIGWATSKTSWTDERAYLVRDRRLVSYIKMYHTALFDQSQIVE